MKRTLAALICALLLLLCACGSPEPAETPAEIIRIGLTEFSESDIRIIEEEFDISLSPPCKAESLYYIWIVARGGSLMLNVSGFAAYEDTRVFVEENVFFPYDGVGYDKHGAPVWIENSFHPGERVGDVWHEGREEILIKKQTISTPECMAILGIESVYENEWPHVAAPPSTKPATTTEAPAATIALRPADKNDLTWARAAMDAYCRHEDGYDANAEIKPVTRTESRSLSRNGRKFEYTICGFAAGELEIDHSIEVREPGGTFFQRLESTNALFDFSIALEDFNNDGYLDVQLFYIENAVMLWDCNFWLWDNQKGQYVENEQLSEIARDARSYGLRAEDGRLKVYFSLSWTPEQKYDYYRWENGEFVMDECVVVSPAMGADGVYDFDYEVTRIWKPVNGELKLVSETREKIQEAAIE